MQIQSLVAQRQASRRGNSKRACGAADVDGVFLVTALGFNPLVLATTHLFDQSAYLTLRQDPLTGDGIMSPSLWGKARSAPQVTVQASLSRESQTEHTCLSREVYVPTMFSLLHRRFSCSCQVAIHLSSSISSHYPSCCSSLYLLRRPLLLPASMPLPSKSSMLVRIVLLRNSAQK